MIQLRCTTGMSSRLDSLTVDSDRDVVLSGLPNAQVALLSLPESPE
jgi:hypothetical protein